MTWKIEGGQFWQNGQELHENYKLGVFGSKKWGEEGTVGQAKFSDSWGGFLLSPPAPSLRETL